MNKLALAWGRLMSALIVGPAMRYEIEAFRRESVDEERRLHAAQAEISSPPEDKDAAS